MSRLMELVEQYGAACLRSADNEKALHAEICDAITELELSAARGRLKPCPFCGGSDVELILEEYTTKYYAAYVSCICGSRGPDFDAMTADDAAAGAADDWNERAGRVPE